MKKNKISPLFISCIMITIVAGAMYFNQARIEQKSYNEDLAKAALAVEYGVYFKEPEQEVINLIDIPYESNFIPIMEQTIEVYDITSKLVEINDQTSLTYESIAQMLLNPIDLQIESDTSEPEILIIHTHGTESYANDENYDYEATSDRRSTDREVSIDIVAKTLYENLNENGINTIFCDEYHDYPVYNGSYDRSLQTIEAYLEQYQSIKMVIDVHRDAIIGSNDEHIYTTTEVDGVECSQLMMVIGTNGSGLDHPDWQDNLNVSVNLQAFIEYNHEGIMRDINLRESRFNQHATTGSMILEVGTSGNTLTQALNAIEVFSQDLADFLLEN